MTAPEAFGGSDVCWLRPSDPTQTGVRYSGSRGRCSSGVVNVRLRVKNDHVC